jgi:hypothetical protein
LPTVLFEDPGLQLTDIAIDTDALYLTELNSPDVLRVSKCDGTTRTLQAPASVDGPAVDLVVAGGHVAWLVLQGLGGWVVAASTAPGAASQVLVHISDPEVLGEALAIDEQRAFFVAGPLHGGGALGSVALQGGTPATLHPGWDGPVAADDTRVYAAESPPTGQALLSVPKVGGTARVLVPSVHGFERAFASDAGYVYWLQWNDNGHGSAVMRVPKRGGAAQTVVPDQSSPSSIAVDDWNVYWLVADAAVPPNRTAMRAPKAGGASDILTSGPFESIALDRRTLYWCTRHAVMKLDK